MRIATRRLIIASAIALAAGAVGIALGNFAAGGEKRSGLDDLAAYNQMFEASENMSDISGSSAPGFDARSGPTSYRCEGCDARPYNEMIADNGADTAPLPPYRPDEGDAVEPVPSPRVGPPGNVTPPRTGPVAADRPRASPTPASSPDGI